MRALVPVGRAGKANSTKGAYFSMAEPQKSEIFGTGHGSEHQWLRVHTPQVGGAPARERRTYYVCRRCGARFAHFYACVSDIFEAMRTAGVQDSCAGAAGAPAPAGEK